MKLSIIIPVFNAEPTLMRCANSVLSQSFDDFEVILVDDGSTDRSGVYCDQLAASHQQVITIHTHNGGPSAARNRALNIANGEYITFVDSDDELHPETIPPLMRILNQHPEYDILEYTAQAPYGKQSRQELIRTDKEYNDYPTYWLCEQGYKHAYMWNKIYRRSLFSDIRFPSCMVFEDLWTQPQLMKRAKIIATTSQGCYIYSDTPTSLTHHVTGEQMRTAVCIHDSLLKELAETHSKDIAFQSYFMHAVNAQIDLYTMTGEILLTKHTVSWKALLYGSTKQKIKVLLYKTLGINNLCKIIQNLQS